VVEVLAAEASEWSTRRTAGPASLIFSGSTAGTDRESPVHTSHEYLNAVDMK
jgi:hypothetical protein